MAWIFCGGQLPRRCACWPSHLASL